MDNFRQHGVEDELKSAVGNDTERILATPSLAEASASISSLSGVRCGTTNGLTRKKMIAAHIKKATLAHPSPCDGGVDGLVAPY
jgi:hypothetical protein